MSDASITVKHMETLMARIISGVAKRGDIAKVEKHISIALASGETHLHCTGVRKQGREPCRYGRERNIPDEDGGRQVKAARSQADDAAWEVRPQATVCTAPAATTTTAPSGSPTSSTSAGGAHGETRRTAGSHENKHDNSMIPWSRRGHDEPPHQLRSAWRAKRCEAMVRPHSHISSTAKSYSS